MHSCRTYQSVENYQGERHVEWSPEGFAGWGIGDNFVHIVKIFIGLWSRGILLLHIMVCELLKMPKKGAG